jgi:hypothetical protein
MHGAVAEGICWPECKNWLEMDVKQGGIQVVAAEFNKISQ